MTPSARTHRTRPPQTPTNAPAMPLEHVATIDLSHARCVEIGLSRIAAPCYDPLGAADLSLERERNRRLFHHAAPVMELLREQVSGSESMVVLTDALGTVLHSVGDDDFLARASKVALQPGVNWSESSKGTNAIGTALVDERPTLVHADEHFMHANHFLTCSAVPILDPRGEVLGVLDVTGDHRGYHQHTMGLVKMSARMIENHWLSEDCRRSMRLQFHAHAGCLDTLMEGIVSVTEDGRIAGGNRAALDLLRLSPVALRRHTVFTLWGVSIGELVDHVRSAHAVPLRLRDGAGREFHAQGRVGWPVPAAVPVAAESAVTPPFTMAAEALPEPAMAGATLAQAQIRLIREAVDQAGGNISAASKKLGVSRNRIYRALRPQTSASASAG